MSCATDFLPSCSCVHALLLLFSFSSLSCFFGAKVSTAAYIWKKFLPRCMKRQDLCMRCGFMLVFRVRIMACMQKVCQSERNFAWGRKMMKNFDREKVAKQMRNGVWKCEIVLIFRSAISVKIVKEHVWGAYLRILACETLCLKVPNTMFGILKQCVWQCQTCSLTILTLVFREQKAHVYR